MNESVRRNFGLNHRIPLGILGEYLRLHREKVHFYQRGDAKILGQSSQKDLRKSNFTGIFVKRTKIFKLAFTLKMKVYIQGYTTIILSLKARTLGVKTFSFLGMFNNIKKLRTTTYINNSGLIRDSSTEARSNSGAFNEYPNSRFPLQLIYAYR
jgi:hypothetical protein